MFYGKWNPKHWEKYPRNSQIVMLGKSIARDDYLHQNTTSSIQTEALFSFSTSSSLSGWRLSLLHVPTQHLSFLAISFVSFWVFLSMIILLPFLLSFYKSFIFKFLRKNDVMRKFKVQFATHEKWRLKLGNRLFNINYLKYIETLTIIIRTLKTAHYFQTFSELKSIESSKINSKQFLNKYLCLKFTLPTSINTKYLWAF